jgi:hypothetical protein
LGVLGEVATSQSRVVVTVSANNSMAFVVTT